MLNEHRDVGLTNDPQFNKASRFDWRRFVPDDVRQVWPALLTETRVIVKVMAEHAAHQAMCQSEL